MKGINTRIQEFEKTIDQMIIESRLPTGYLLSYFRQKCFQLEKINQQVIEAENKPQPQESEVSENGNN